MKNMNILVWWRGKESPGQWLPKEERFFEQKISINILQIIMYILQIRSIRL